MILLDLEIQTDNLIPPRTPDLVIINKQTNKQNSLPNYELYRPGGQQSENQRKRKVRQVIGPCQRTKKLWDMKL